MPQVLGGPQGLDNKDSTRWAGWLPSRSAPGERSLVRVNARSVWTALVLVAVFLWCMHLLVVASILAGSPMLGTNRFHLDVEGNLPSFFSSMILMISAVLLGLIAVVKKNENDRFALHWVLLGVVFFLMSVDEAASFHELLIDPLRHAFNLTGFLRFSWVLVGVPFVLVFTYAYSHFLMALPRSFAGMFLLSGGMYVTGAVGMEMIGAYFFGENDMNNWQYMAAMTAEEVLEMSGILLFIRTLLAYLKSYCSQFSLRLA